MGMSALNDMAYRRVWLAALVVFVLAGATGAFLRFGVLHGMAGLNYVNVRHAHSHLMYFGWVTPGLMAVIAATLPRLTGRPNSPWLGRIVALTIVMGLLAYIPFLLYGYAPAEVGGARLPLSVMAASLNVLAWYAFAVVYRRATRGAPPTRPLWLWNAAVAFLLLATLGVWGLPVLAATGAQNPLWSALCTHLFLDLFSEGWIVLAALGLAYAANPAAARQPWARRGGDLLVIGLPVVFLLFVPQHLLPPGMRWVGSIGGLLVIAGLAANLIALWPNANSAWRAPLVFLAIKTAVMVALLLPGAAQWAETARLRVPYLHLLLLGFTTLSLFAGAEGLWGVRGRRAMTIAVTLLIVTLLPLTGLWPPALGGLWALRAAAWAALGPVVVAVWVLFRSVVPHRSQHTFEVMDS